MNVILEIPHKIFPVADAYELATTLNADPEDDWFYRVEENPVEDKPTAIIKVYDEEDNFVANL